MAGIVEVSDGSFEAEVLDHRLPAIVDFWGDHCPSCTRIAPILEELAERYAGRVRVLGMHAVDNPRTAARYGVRAMPTVIGFAGAEVVGQLVGARPKAAFVELAERLLG